MKPRPPINIVNLLNGLENRLVAKSRRHDRIIGFPSDFTERQLLEARFFKYVKKGEGDQCWIWVGYTRPDGYGTFQIFNRTLRANRVSFVLSNNREPSGLICHSCDNPSCVNPSHFFEGDYRDNAADCVAKGRAKGGRSPGEKNYSAKLTNSEVLEIRRMREAGMLLSELAAQFKISETAVANIHKRNTWKHL